MTLLTTDEVAAELRRKPRFVREELKRGNLRGSRVGGDWRIREDDLESYLEAQLNVPREDRRRRRRAS